MRLLGEDVQSCDDGGGISVKGNTTINGLGTLPVIALILVSLLGGSGGMALLINSSKCPAAPVPTPIAKPDATQDWRLTIQVKNSP